MKIKYLLLLAILTILQIGCDSNVKSQTSSNNQADRAATFKTVRLDEAEVSSKFERVNLETVNSETIKQQPAPRFSLYFRCLNSEADCVNGERRQELTAEARELIDNYWKQLLNFNIEMMEAQKCDDYKGRYRLPKDQETAANKFFNDLQNTEIDAPAGRREISDLEAGQIYRALKGNACYTVEYKKDCKICDPVDTFSYTPSSFTVGGEEMTEKDEAIVSGEFARVMLTYANEQKIKQQPAPQFFLYFRCTNGKTNCTDGERREALPAQAQTLANDYWKHLLDNSYAMTKNKTDKLGYENYMQMVNKHLAKATAFEKDMRKIEIDAPAGKRKLSDKEVGQIMRILNNSVCQTIQQSDVCRRDESETK